MTTTDKRQSDPILSHDHLRKCSADTQSIVEAHHGGLDEQELHRYGLRSEQMIDFSSNILPQGPSHRVQLAIGSCNLAAYPDRNCTQLRDVIAASLGIEASRILVGNGGSELIHLLARSLIAPGENVLVIGPTFSEYERASQLAAANLTYWRSSEIDQFAVDCSLLGEQLQASKSRVVWLCNPNNPTGQIVQRADVLEWIRANRQTLFIVDESYIEFSVQCDQLSLCTFDEPNLIVLRSMTKSFGMAGVRLGYVVVPESYYRLLCCQRVPWSVSSIAQAAGIAALQDLQHYRRAIAQTIAEKNRLVAGLASIGLKSIPSQTNFFILPVENAQRMRQSLLLQGLVVRDCNSFGLPNYLRIAALDAQSNSQLIKELASINGGGKLDRDRDYHPSRSTSRWNQLRRKAKTLRLNPWANCFIRHVLESTIS